MIPNDAKEENSGELVLLAVSSDVVVSVLSAAGGAGEGDVAGGGTPTLVPSVGGATVWSVPSAGVLALVLLFSISVSLKEDPVRSRNTPVVPSGYLKTQGSLRSSNSVKLLKPASWSTMFSP